MSFFVSSLLFSSLHGFTDDDDDDDDDDREERSTDDDEFAGTNVSEAGSVECRYEEVGCQRGRLTGMG